MRKTVLSIAFVAVSLAAASLAFARGPAPAFVMPNEIDVAAMLPPPPADESVLHKAEIAELYRIEAVRTAADIARARADEAERDIFIFRSVLGARFNATNLPVTAALSRDVDRDEWTDLEPAKKIFPRMRPYNFDKSLHPVCRTKTKNDSYPSGHAMTGYLMGLVLSSMLPERRGAIFARADDYVHNRLVCGVHHRSDLLTGEDLAYALFSLMAEKPRFQKERRAAEAEMRKILNLPARYDAAHATR